MLSNVAKSCYHRGMPRACIIFCIVSLNMLHSLASLFLVCLSREGDRLIYPFTQSCMSKLLWVRIMRKSHSKRNYQATVIMWRATFKFFRNLCSDSESHKICRDGMWPWSELLGWRTGHFLAWDSIVCPDRFLIGQCCLSISWRAAHVFARVPLSHSAPATEFSRLRVDWSPLFSNHPLFVGNNWPWLQRTSHTFVLRAVTTPIRAFSCSFPAFEIAPSPSNKLLKWHQTWILKSLKNSTVWWSHVSCLLFAEEFHVMFLVWPTFSVSSWLFATLIDL